MKENKSNFIIAFLILVIIGLLIYFTIFKIDISKNLEMIDKKIGIINNNIDSVTLIQNKYYTTIDSLKKIRTNLIISNKYYIEYEKIKNTNNYDSIFNNILAQLDSLKSPKFTD